MDYSSTFFNTIQTGSQNSAQVVVPLIMEWISPRSVIDIGCGNGDWLATFNEQGVTSILGVDQYWGDERPLKIRPDQLIYRDLTQTLKLNQKFDLAVSLEVAEHLAPHCAPEFIAWLVDLAPVVLFSAAIPGQGGMHHRNEQWPEYWAKLFEKHNYRCIDCLRPMLWDDPRVEWWYAQNSMLYVAKSAMSQFPKLLELPVFHQDKPLALVHPRLLAEHANLARWIKPLQKIIVVVKNWFHRHFFAKS